MLSCCRTWPVKACIEMGTSCMLCERRCAVTVISSRASLAPSAVAARHLAPDRAPRIAAIDMESLEFINHPLFMRISSASRRLFLPLDRARALVHYSRNNYTERRFSVNRPSTQFSRGAAYLPYGALLSRHHRYYRSDWFGFQNERRARGA